MRKPQKDIQLTSYHDLLGIEESEASDMDKIIEVPLSDLHSFKNHPFYVKDDEKMAETVESIKKYGVLNPGIVRKRAGGGYELIAGHRRKRASQLAKKSTMPVIIRDYKDDEAIMVMVDSNIQRENILPSEKAFAYAMKTEAMKHQGLKGDGAEETAAMVGREAGDSGRKVQRYIRLTQLLPQLLDLVDEEKIKFIPAVCLSYLSKQEQEWVLNCMIKNGESVSGSKAEMLKRTGMEGKLTEQAVELIMCKKKECTGRVVLPEKKIQKYFPTEYSIQQIEEVIFSLLDDWKVSQ